MRGGMSPQAATEDSIRRIAKKYPNFVGGLIALNKQGDYGAAGWGWTLQYSVRNPQMDSVQVVSVPRLNPQ